MLLSTFNKRIISSLVIFSFCFIVFGCDYLTQQQQKKEEISLKGDRITAEIDKNNIAISDSECCSKGQNLYEVYEVNTNSPKAKKLKKRIKQTLEKLNSKSKQGNNSSYDVLPGVQEPDLENSTIVENTNNGREILVTPIYNGSETINQRAYTPYDSETNSVSSQIFFYEATTNLTASELNAIETNPQVADEATVQFEVKDQNGIILYSKSFNKTQFNNIQSISNTTIAKQPTSTSCFGDCFIKIVKNLPWYSYALCMLQPVPCLTGVAITCGLHCWVYDGRYL